MNHVTLLGSNTSAASALTNATAVGSRARVDLTNALVLGSINGINGATESTRVGVGTSAPDGLLDLVSDASLGADTLVATHHNDSGAGPVLTFRKTRGTRSADRGAERRQPAVPAVNYGKLPLLAVQAIKELKTLVDELRSEKASVERRLTALERQVTAGRRSHRWLATRLAGRHRFDRKAGLA